jgi:nicotinate-nucleotide pyrophosphorylase (carboxylating)
MSQQKDTIKAALREDIGKRDLTSELIIPAEKNVNAVIITRQACMLCGLDIAKQVFKTQDKKIGFAPLARDGQYLKKDEVLARIKGKASSILTAERVALNFLTLLSGIATKTYEFVKAVRPYKVKVLDTRKTIPGLRELQKYAVRIGGGYNHRMSLSDMVLVKDNHIKVTRSQGHKVTSIIEKIRKKTGKKIKVEIEVKNLREFKEALKAAPDIIMLDNMKVSDIKKAVEIRRQMTKHYPLNAIRYTLLEASGGITLKNVNKVASTGINMISVGALTHSVKSIDMSLEIL